MEAEPTPDEEKEAEEEVSEESGQEGGSYVVISTNPLVRCLLRFFWVPILGTAVLYLIHDFRFPGNPTTLFQWTFTPAHFLGFWIACRVLRFKTPQLLEKLVENNALDEADARSFGKDISKKMSGRACELFSIAFASLFLLFYLLEDWTNAPVLLGFHTLFDVTLSYLLGQILWKGSVIGIGIYRLGKIGQLAVQPFHRDRCGGLSSLGELCFSGSLVLVVAGSFLSFWLFYAVFLFPAEHGIAYFSPSMFFLFTMGLVIVAILTVTFLALPLQSIHLVMCQRAHELEGRYTEVANELANKEELLLVEGPRMAHPEFALECERIRSLRTILDRKRKLPRWPIPVHTRVRFATAQVPMALGLAASVQQLSAFAIDALGK